MIKQPPAEITPHITLLGRVESNVHWVHDGDDGVLLGGGMTYTAPDLLAQMDELGIDPRSISRLIVLHAHFDHVGMVPFLKKRFPWLRIVGSPRAQSGLAREQVQSSIAMLNEQAAALNGATERVRELGCEYTPFQIDEVVRDGDELQVGGLALRILEVPGHSSCSIAAYMPREKALFASDATGVRFGNLFLATGNSNFDEFEQSLRKLAELDVEILLPEHYGTALGEEARQHLPRAIREAEVMRRRLEDSYRRTRDVAASTREITDEISRVAPDGFFPRPVLEMVIGQMLRFTAKKMGNA